MRPVLVAAIAVALGAGDAMAEPTAAPGWRLETVTMPGAILCGLSRDRDTLLVTDLAAGRLLRRNADGSLVPFGPTFPHGLDVINDPTGPYRAARVGDLLIVAQGWTPVDQAEGPLDHALVAVDDAGATRVLSNEFWNPYDFTARGDRLYVVDAAENSIKTIGVDGSDQATILTFKRLTQTGSDLQSLSPTEFSKGESYETDAVPTGIAPGADNRLYVSLFGGFPFLAGAGKVVSFPADAVAPPMRVEVEGLNAPVDVAFDGAGGLLVLEHGLFRQEGGFTPESGRLLLVDEATGDREVILDRLTRPVAALLWDEDEIVVSDLGGHLHFLTRQ